MARGQRPRYVINTESEVIHDRWTLDERCNLDDIHRDNRIDTNETIVVAAHLQQPPLYSLCSWCFSGWEG